MEGWMGRFKGKDEWEGLRVRINGKIKWEE